MKEIWKDIKNYEGKYQVSNLGRVKSLKRYKENYSKLQLVPEKILAQADNGNGYKFVSLWKDSKQKMYYIHRLVAETFIPNEHDLKQVNHKDGIKNNNSILNLEWCSCSENQKHAYKKLKRITAKNNKHTSFKVNKLDDKNNIIESYPSMREAERQNGYSNGVISKGIQKGYMTGGYYWEIIK